MFWPTLLLGGAVVGSLPRKGDTATSDKSRRKEVFDSEALGSSSYDSRSYGSNGVGRSHGGDAPDVGRYPRVSCCSGAWAAALRTLADSVVRILWAMVVWLELEVVL